ncbi:glycosyltransferase [Patescibacteria group bacterium]
MKIALVHDYLREYGGAEQVLRTLSDMYPNAPIHVAFKVDGSTGDRKFADRIVKESRFATILKIWKLYSPLRFLTPWIWKSFDLSEYDVVVTSAGWYITRGFRVGQNTKVICYCHTPPRWLYGYESAGRYQKYWLVKMYAQIVGYFLRRYDKSTVDSVDYWVSNSKNVEDRIINLYGVDPLVIYPPVEIEKFIEAAKSARKGDYMLIVSRLTGAKGILEAAKAANKYKFSLKIAGESSDVSGILIDLKKQEGKHVELLGRVPDDEIASLYAKAKGFLALAKDEDFGITPVEAMASGTPVIAYDGGGFRESVIDGKTGILVKSQSPKTIADAVKKLKRKKWDKKVLQTQAKKFSKEKFVGQFSHLVRTI